MKTKKNWYLISAIVIVVGLLVCSGYQFYTSNLSNSFNNLDAITLTVSLIGSNPFNYFGVLLPLVIALIIVGTTSKTENKNKKEKITSFKSFIISNKKVLKVSLLMPTILIFIFIVSCFITNFNFDYSDIPFPIGTYDGFMYTNFAIYLSVICIIQYILSLVYANLTLLALRINRNKLLAISLSYLLYVLLYVSILYGLYVGILQNIFGVTNMYSYFNIVGYCLFINKSELFYSTLFSSGLLLLTTILTYLICKSPKNK